MTCATDRAGTTLTSVVSLLFDLIYCSKRHFQQYFSYNALSGRLLVYDLLMGLFLD
jgi:hypothetical protein